MGLHYLPSHHRQLPLPKQMRSAVCPYSPLHAEAPTQLTREVEGGVVFKEALQVW